MFFSIGRRPSFFIYLFIECLFGTATAFAQDFVTWTVLRVGVGFTIPAILGTPFVLGKTLFIYHYCIVYIQLDNSFVCIFEQLFLEV